MYLNDTILCRRRSIARIRFFWWLALGAATPSAAQIRSADSLAAYGTPSVRPATFRWADPAVDRWVDHDKGQHFIASALIAGVAQHLLVQAGVPERRAWPAALVVGVQVGLFKETYDAYRPGGSGFSVRDLAWDAAGLGVGVWMGSSRRP